LHTERREVLVTTLLDARPTSRHCHPDDSIWPLGMAICMGVVFIGSIFSPYLVLVGFGLAVIAGAGWAHDAKASHEKPAIMKTPHEIVEWVPS
jgi:hypothetical protein